MKGYIKPITEPHEQWVGLAYVERHGLPGYPPPNGDQKFANYSTAAIERWVTRRFKDEFTEL